MLLVVTDYNADIVNEKLGTICVLLLAAVFVQTFSKRCAGLRGLGVLVLIPARLLSDFRPPNLPAFAWRAAGDISAEVFSMREPST